MNLLEDEWLSVIRLNGEQEKLKGLWRITEGDGNPIVDVISPRADFKGALYQLLIGLVQTSFAPKNETEWEKYWLAAPDVNTLKNAFLTVTEAFALQSSDYLFMQSYDDEELENEDSLPIEDIIGGTLSTETRKKNRDHFDKRGVTNSISPYWAAIALFNMQISGVPAWGQHRVGLRGNGAITTLVFPHQSEKSTLWHKIWLNTFDKKTFDKNIEGNSERTAMQDIFPWMGRTRVSPNKEKDMTSPQNCNALQHYWAMPRRIKLIISEESKKCDLTNEDCQFVVSKYKRLKDGVLYAGDWKHPLTPYYIDPDHKKFPVSIKTSFGGFIYSQWVENVLGRNNVLPAKTIEVYLDRCELISGDRQANIWAFGNHTESANILCWYEANMPIFPIPKDKREDIKDYAGKMIDAVNTVASDVRENLLSAWYKEESIKRMKKQWRKPGSSPEKELEKILFFIQVNFWQLTETEFYRLLEKLINCGEDEKQVNALFDEWKRLLRTQALTLFDHWALSGNNEDGDMKRVVVARRQLEIWLNVGKNIKALVA